MLRVQLGPNRHDIPERLARVSWGMSDGEIKRCAAECLRVPPARFLRYRLDRPPNGDLILRPA